MEVPKALADNNKEKSKEDEQISAGLS